MQNDRLRRSLGVFPMASAMRLTDLSARQIRYYEAQGLITPERSDGGTRLFSMDDLETLLDIKLYLERGFTMKRINELLKAKTEPDAFDILSRQESRKPLINRSDLSRFFNK